MKNCCTLLVLIFVVISGFASSREVEFVWSHFWTDTNPLTPFRDVLIEGFNEKYARQYKVVNRETPGDPAHEERTLAETAIDQLPDLVTCNSTCIKRVFATGKAFDLTDFVVVTAWGERFIEVAFDPYFSTADFKFDGTGDRLLAISYTLNNVGIY
jgi:ABC-type glycerol-3-phosphate transport system substrate-binding protein